MSLGRSAGVTDTGRRRRRNEDSYLCEPPLFAIADGMGGAQAGEVASRLAAAVLQEADVEELTEARLAELIREANRRVFQRSSEDSATSGMGTTMTVALVDGSGDSIAIGHVGDSRAYRVRGGRLEQLTEDHSLVGELMRSGRLSPEEAESHPQRSVITRAIGTDADVEVDTFTLPAEPGDIYLLCSDGLTDMVRDDEIRAVLEDADDLDRAARALVDAANERGGEDNVTVVLFQIVGSGDADTVQLPTGVATDQPDPELEDTVSGLEAAPAVDTAVVPAAAIQAHLEQEPEPVRPPQKRQAQRRQESRTLLPLVLLVLILLAIGVLVVWGLYR